MAVDTARAAPEGAREAAKTETWYRSTWNQLYRFVYARVQNREEAEDLTQETYSKLLARGESGPPTPQYLYTTVLNLIRDRWRRKQTRGATVPLDEALLVRAGHEEDAAVSRAWVRSLMDRLPADYRTVLELRIVQGYSRTEVARRMGKSETVVRGLQYRALQALREMMRDEIGEGR